MSEQTFSYDRKMDRMDGSRPDFHKNFEGKEHSVCLHDWAVNFVEQYKYIQKTKHL